MTVTADLKAALSVAAPRDTHSWLESEAVESNRSELHINLAFVTNVMCSIRFLQLTKHFA